MVIVVRNGIFAVRAISTAVLDVRQNMGTAIRLKNLRTRILLQMDYVVVNLVIHALEVCLAIVVRLMGFVVRLRYTVVRRERLDILVVKGSGLISIRQKLCC